MSKQNNKRDTAVGKAVVVVGFRGWTKQVNRTRRYKLLVISHREAQHGDYVNNSTITLVTDGNPISHVEHFVASIMAKAICYTGETSILLIYFS